MKNGKLKLVMPDGTEIEHENDCRPLSAVVATYVDAIHMLSHPDVRADEQLFEDWKAMLQIGHKVITHMTNNDMEEISFEEYTVVANVDKLDEMHKEPDNVQ